jgi:aspartyl-tRNA(Asn)/glutamyl-tRNA(Gln) amidotransferase subunit A
VKLLEAAEALRAGRVSSSELVSEALTRIRRGADLNAFITVIEDEAREAARAADEERARGIDKGPLHGIPVAVKDVFATRGVRTTAGSKIFENYVPDQDAAAVERLREAGAILVGKTNQHELAYGITSTNPHYGAVRNPWDRERIPGGSSGGSAVAVVAGMVFAALGNDTGGSIRLPASFCGVTGLKPTYGRVSRYGVLPLDFSLDHVGPITRSAGDAAAVLSAIAGHDPRDPSSSARPVKDYTPPVDGSLPRIRIGVPENFFFERLDPAVVEAVRAAAAAAEGLGAKLVPVRVPDIDALNTIGRMILLAEASAVMEPYMGEREKFGPDVLALLDQGRVLAATDYVNAQRVRRVKQREFSALWREIDVLFTPATPTGAPRIGQARIEISGRQEDVRVASTRFVRPFNTLGLPAISIPAGFDAQGMPVGLQIAGPAFHERDVLRVAAAVERALGVKAEIPTAR